MKTKLFIMLIGIQGSGKSYLARQLADQYEAKIFSSDEYRQRLCGDVSDQTQNKLVFETLYRDMIEAIENQWVIFDATNTTKRIRALALARVPKEAVKIAYVLDTPLKECLERDAMRDRTVGEKVINKYYNNFEYSSYDEGFDKIIYVKH